MDVLCHQLGTIEGSPVFGSDGVVLVTYDEGADKPFPNRFNILLLGTGPLVAPGLYGGSPPLSHYSPLRAIEDRFALPHLGGARTAPPVPDIWQPSG